MKTKQDLIQDLHGVESLIDHYRSEKEFHNKLGLIYHAEYDEELITRYIKGHRSILRRIASIENKENLA